VKAVLNLVAGRVRAAAYLALLQESQAGRADQYLDALHGWLRGGPVPSELQAALMSGGAPRFNPQVDVRGRA
jgi:hypothetical protein